MHFPRYLLTGLAASIMGAGQLQAQNNDGDPASSSVEKTIPYQLNRKNDAGMRLRQGQLLSVTNMTVAEYHAFSETAHATKSTRLPSPVKGCDDACSALKPLPKGRHGQMMAVFLKKAKDNKDIIISATPVADLFAKPKTVSKSEAGAMLMFRVNGALTAYDGNGTITLKIEPALPQASAIAAKPASP